MRFNVPDFWENHVSCIFKVYVFVGKSTYHERFFIYFYSFLLKLPVFTSPLTVDLNIHLVNWSTFEPPPPRVSKCQNTKLLDFGDVLFLNFYFSGVRWFCDLSHI